MNNILVRAVLISLICFQAVMIVLLLDQKKTAKAESYCVSIPQTASVPCRETVSMIEGYSDGTGCAQKYRTVSFVCEDNKLKSIDAGAWQTNATPCG